MKFYAQYNDAGTIYAISQVDSDMVKLDEYNPDLLGATFDSETGEFSGYRVALSNSKRSVEVGESVEVTATIVNWDRSPSDFSGDVLFRVNDTKQTVKARDGVAVLTYQAEIAGDVTIRTDNEDFISNESIMVEVEEPEPETEPEEEGAAE